MNLKADMKEIVREYMVENGLTWIKYRGTSMLLDEIKDELREALDNAMYEVIEEI